MRRSRLRVALVAMAAGAGVMAGGYGALAAMAWYRYGRVGRGDGRQHDELLDQFMAQYEIVERHHVRVSAPAPVTLEAAREQDLLSLPVVRSIFRAREIALGVEPSSTAQQPRGLIAAVKARGWGVLAAVPDREIVMGAVTRPWEPNVTFRAIPASEFRAFSEPGLVKIAWTLRADAVDEKTSVFRTETRAIATDAAARARFRFYWAFASPGIALIRWLSLPPLKCEAERRARLAPALSGAGEPTGATRDSS